MIQVPSAFTTANLELVKRPIFLVEIAGFADKFTNRATGEIGQRPWLKGIDEQSITVSEIDGGADLGELTFTVLDYQQTLTASFPSFVFEGKVVTLKTGFVGMDQTDFALLFTGVVDRVESVENNSCYKFTCVDNKQLLTKVIYTVADDGLPTDSDHTRTLNAHPLDILVSILEDEIGYVAGDIDITTIEAYRDGIFAGVQFQFTIDSPPQAKEFIEQQLMKPLGGYIWVNNEGRISVNFFYPSNFDALLTLNHNHIVGIPEAQQLDLINVVSTRFDKSTDGKYLAEDVEEYGDSVTRYGQYGQQVIESDGLRSGLQGFFTAAMTAQQIFLRYGLKQLTFESLKVFWSACILEPGDVVAITHAKVPDRIAGVMGIADKLFIVLDRQWDFNDCVTTYRLLDADFLDRFGRFRYAPDGKGAYTTVSADDKARYMFMCNDTDTYSNSDPANTLG